MNTRINQLAANLGELLLARQMTVSCAESCTGGGVASAITEVAGSSQWFHAGFVTYSNGAKQQFLKVSGQSLSESGAVSELVVREMVAGVLAETGADLAVAVSGIAGPDGGSKEKPVGTVWFAWGFRTGESLAQCYLFSGDRHQVREAAIEQALTGLVEMIRKKYKADTV